MSDYLMRDAAPLSEETWAKIDGMVVDVFKKTVVGRRFVEIVGPLGWGVGVAPQFGFASEDGADVATEPTYKPLVDLEQEFLLKAKQLAIASQTPYGLDLGAVALAALKLAKREDELIIGGLLKAAKSSAALGDWNVLGGPFGAIVAAQAQMRQKGFAAPYALVLSPALFARLASLMNQGRRELEQVEKIVTGGIFQWPDMADNQALLVSLGAWNFDLVLGQDVVTAYVGNEGLDQKFCILESFVLRVKLPGAACVLK